MAIAAIHTWAGTENELDGEDSFQNISVLQNISQWVLCNVGSVWLKLYRLLLPSLKELRQKVKVSDTADGDGKHIFLAPE